MRRFSLVLLVAATLFGCSQFDEIDQPIPGGTEIGGDYSKDALPDVLYASIAEEEQSRTFVDGDNVLWNRGESISYYAGEYGNAKYTMREGLYDGTANAEFVQAGDAAYTFESATDFSLAVYPYSEAQQANFVDGRYLLSATYAQEQRYAPNSFGKGADLMVATGALEDATNLHFRHACGYLVIKLYGTATRVANITLTALGEDVKLSGERLLSVGLNENVQFNEWAESASNSVSLDCSNDSEGVLIGSDEESATEFWFALPPTTIEGGFQITVTDNEGNTYTKQTTKDIEIKRNEIQPMKAFAIGRTKPTASQIWYTQAEGVTEPTTFGVEQPFDANISKHYYNADKGLFIIQFDAPVKVIKEKALYLNQSVLDVILPDGLEKIETLAFAGDHMFIDDDIHTSLRSINIPGTVQVIETDVFCYAGNLKKVVFEPSPTSTPLQIYPMSNKFGPLEDANLDRLEIYRYFDYQITPIEATQSLFGGSNAKELIIGEQVTKIDSYMFCGLAMTDLVIPNHITEIGESAFLSSDFEKVTIPESVKQIGINAFMYCWDLKEIVIEDSDKSLQIGIHYWALDEFGPFDDCPIEKVYLGRNVEYLDDFIPDENDEGLFYTSRIKVKPDLRTAVTIGDKVTKLIPRTFSSSCIESITIPANVEYIGYDAFHACEYLTSVTIEDSDTPLTIGYTHEVSDEWGPFYDSPLTDVYLGRDIVQVTDEGTPSVADGWEEGVFSSFKYSDSSWETNIDIGEKVTAITDYMFSHSCVKYLYIYPAIESIGYRAFYNCDKFQGISCNHLVPPTLGEGAFKDCDNMWYIKVPAEAIETFKSADGWKEFDKMNIYGKNFYYEMESN